MIIKNMINYDNQHNFDPHSSTLGTSAQINKKHKLNTSVLSLCYSFMLLPPMLGRVGQIMDDELFSNECGSSNFNNFLNLLGDCVQLKVSFILSFGSITIIAIASCCKI